MSRRTKGHYPFSLKFNRRESFLIAAHGQSQSRTVCPFFFRSRQEFLCQVWKKQSYMRHLFNKHHDRLITFLLFVRSQHLIARKMFVSSLATGSHPSWSSLLQFNLFLVHFYGVLDSIQFRCWFEYCFRFCRCATTFYATIKIQLLRFMLQLTFTTHKRTKQNSLLSNIL